MAVGAAGVMVCVDGAVSEGGGVRRKTANCNKKPSKSNVAMAHPTAAELQGIII